MKLSEYIEKYGDCEVTDEIDKCIVKAPKTGYDLKYGDEYFFLTESGIVQGGIWRDDMFDALEILKNTNEDFRKTLKTYIEIYECL